LSDHEPLQAACNEQLPVFLLYIYEPKMLEYNDSSHRHIQFILESISDMNAKLAAFDAKVEILEGNAEQIFDYLREKFHICNVFSHQETGVKWTFERDKILKKHFVEHGIKWKEFQTNGVERGLRNREGWEKRRRNLIDNGEVQNPNFEKIKTINVANNAFDNFIFEKSNIEISKNFQIGGTTNAKNILQSFIEQRNFSYIKHLAHPLESQEFSSRISPYLAWGNISARQVSRMSKKKMDSTPQSQRNLRAFLSRNAWRDHFIQRFEMEETIETEYINHFASLLNRGNDEKLQLAWQLGQTGFPLIDAAMRAVTATGWLNFRLRATVVSFLTHILWQDWQIGAKFLARQFLDYEPGIHYCQFQMQSGDSGFHTIRVYNPIKQSLEKDTDAKFLRKWLPELSNLPNNLIHEPWKMGGLDEMFYGITLGKHYPQRIVNFENAYKHATKTLWAWRKKADVVREAKRLIERHRE
jgi:deoxyribodipyrimidine photo-lyase